ncbi:Rieske 2Fe-2S domain-containing protein [Streptomyces sviceus]|uniref:Rieske 2Fe-2S domain-containing protein n=1 Tax=Streptomyces sviceus TaxID=285530 RepID=UPI0036C0AA5F
MSVRRRHPRTRENRVLRLLARLEREPRQDPVIDGLRAGIRSLPIGSRLSAAVLDVTKGRPREAGLLVGVGLAAAGPAALTGAVDRAELRRPQSRVGLVHAVSSTVAVGLYTASLVCRLTGRSRAGRTLGFLGLAAVGSGGMLGGHLAYRQAAGVNHAEAVPHVVRDRRHRIGAVDDFPPGRPVRRGVDDVPVVVVREADGSIHALADRCSHLNVRSPALAPQPAFDARVTDGQVELRLVRHDGQDGREQRAGDGREPDRRRNEAGRGSAHDHTH